MENKVSESMKEGFQLMQQGQASPFEMDEDERFIADLTQERKVSYCSMVPKNEDEEIILFNAMNSSDKRLGDCINETLEVSHIYVEVVKCKNQETGEETLCPRVVLIDKDGISYQCVSIGIFSSVKKILSVKGNPGNWKAPVKLKVEQITKGTNKLLSLRMVSGNNAKGK